MKNILTPLGKSVLISLGFSAAALAKTAAIQRKFFGSGMTSVIIPNKEINDIIKIVKSLEESSLLIKGFSRTIANEANKQKGGFIGMLAGTLAASLLGKMLAGKQVIQAGGRPIRAGERKIRAGQNV